MLRAAAQGGGAVRVAYFEEAGCRECARADRMLKLAAERHPASTCIASLRLRAKTACCWRCSASGRGWTRRTACWCRPSSPGAQALVQKAITDEALDGLIASAGGDAPLSLDVSAQERAAAEQRLWKRSLNMSLAAMTAGGLVDGINPCAFATIIFLVCCLAGMGRGRLQILAVGTSFTVGVFLAYLLMGIGAQGGAPGPGRAAGGLAGRLHHHRGGRVRLRGAELPGLGARPARTGEGDGAEAAGPLAHAHQRADIAAAARAISGRRRVRARGDGIAGGADLHGAGLPAADTGT